MGTEKRPAKEFSGVKNCLLAGGKALLLIAYHNRQRWNVSVRGFLGLGLPSMMLLLYCFFVFHLRMGDFSQEVEPLFVCIAI